MTLTSGQSHVKPISAFALISWGAHGHTHASQTTRLARRAVHRGAAGRGARVPASAEGSDQGFDGSRNRRLTAAVRQRSARQRSARQRSLDSIPPDNRRSAECAAPACGKPRRPAQLRQLPSGMLYWHRLHTVAQRSAAPAMTQREVNDVIGK